MLLLQEPLLLLLEVVPVLVGLEVLQQLGSLVPRQ
jgi:hypothetical protein